MLTNGWIALTGVLSISKAGWSWIMAKDVDWDAIEREYRAGVKTYREIGANFGISHCTIQKRANKEGWTRNLSERIKQKTAEKVIKAEVTRKVTKITEREIVESVAEQQAAVLLNERSDIMKLSGLYEKFRLELEDYPEDPEKKFRTLKHAVDISEKLINLRRRNYNINDNSLGVADAPKELESFIINAIGTVLRPPP
jgi:hypothetical protein